jgi:hypothetical protein
VLGLDHYAPFLFSAFGITLLVLGAYALYLRSRLQGLRNRELTLSQDQDYSARNVSAAAPRAATAQAASSANGPSTP